MKIRFKKACIVRGYFFAGRPEERAALVCRMPNYFGYYLLIIPNTYLGKKPKDGEEWRFEMSEVEADPTTMTARAVCIPLNKVEDVGQAKIGARPSVRTTRAPKNPAEAEAVIRAIFAPKSVKTNRRAQEKSRAASLKCGNKTTGATAPRK